MISMALARTYPYREEKYEELSENSGIRRSPYVRV